MKSGNGSILSQMKSENRNYEMETVMNSDDSTEWFFLMCKKALFSWCFADFLESMSNCKMAEK